MATDNDSELRDLVTQTLESNGVLGKIRAQLRASVFLALEEQDALRNKAPSVNKDLKNFLLTRGLLVFSLLREFLEFYNLEFTLAVLDAESNTKDRLQRNDLCDEYQLKSCKVPVVTELLRHTSGRSNTVTSEASSAKSSSQTESVSSQQLASEVSDADRGMGRR
ncbi:FGFR1OP (predicted) [Pycnogonum litorale]